VHPKAFAKVSGPLSVARIIAKLDRRIRMRKTVSEFEIRSSTVQSDSVSLES